MWCCDDELVEIHIPPPTADGYMRWRLHKPIDIARFNRIQNRVANICERLCKFDFILFSFHITTDAIIIGDGSTTSLSLFLGKQSQTLEEVAMFNNGLSHSRVMAAVLFLSKLEMGNDMDIIVEQCEPACVGGWSLVRAAVDGDLDVKDWRELVSQV
jgi:hypothetical protein